MRRSSVLFLAACLLPAMGVPIATASEDESTMEYQKPDSNNVSFFDLKRPVTDATAWTLADQATPAGPVELHFSSGAWTGSVTTTGGKFGDQLLKKFLATDPSASRERSVVGITAESELEGVGSVLRNAAQDVKPRNHVSKRGADSRSSRVASSQLLDVCEGTCSDPHNVPRAGTLDQFRQQGLIEQTTHTLRGLGGGETYPTVFEYCGRDLGVPDPSTGTCAFPVYGYEHDYKVLDNGYVTRTENYSWSSNLPGAYRYTRDQDYGDDLDFTIGSAFTWLLKRRLTYTINTNLRSPQTGDVPNVSRAKLTGSVLPVTPTAGCRYEIDPDTAQVVGNPSINPYCFGLTGSAGDASYIAIPDFRIRYDGTCRNWVHNEGATFC